MGIRTRYVRGNQVSQATYVFDLFYALADFGDIVYTVVLNFNLPVFIVLEMKTPIHDPLLSVFFFLLSRDFKKENLRFILHAIID